MNAPLDSDMYFHVARLFPWTCCYNSPDLYGHSTVCIEYLLFLLQITKNWKEKPESVGYWSIQT